jgi:outer membrane protein insertion porin family
VYIKHDFLPVFQRRGYLKATFGTPSAKVVEDGPEETSVDVTVPVTPGTEYHLKDVQWSGNTAFPSTQLASLIKLKPGEPVNAPLLMENLHAVAKLYSTRGYMRPKIEPQANFDDEHATVGYHIPVVEGDVYRMGELEVRGLDTRTADRVAFLWKLHQGDVYDSSYFARFRETLGPDFPKDVTWKIDVRETVDEKDKTVDVSLLFRTGSSR